jgi:hypothetical protein
MQKPVKPGLPFPDPSVPKPLAQKFCPPIDISAVRDEKGVKAIVKRLLDHFGWFFWMPGANGFGTQGVHDFCAIKDGAFITIETKFGKNKPTPVQKAFAGHMAANSAFPLLVYENTLDHLYWFLASFDHSVARERAKLPVEDAHGARMVNALAVLNEGW